MHALVLVVLLAAEAPAAVPHKPDPAPPAQAAAAPAPAPAPSGSVALAVPPPIADAERLLASEVTAGVGFLGSSYSQPGYRLGDAHFAPSLTGRYVFHGFTADGGVLLVVPVTADGTAFAFTASLRAGWTWRKWSLLAGAVLQVASGAQPALQVLPTLRLSADFGPVGATLGVLDWLGLVPAHLSFDMKLGGRRFSFGWAFPIGLLASLDLPVSGRWGLKVSGFAFKAFQSEFAMVTVAGTFGGER